MNPQPKELLEKLANLEHDQWMKWSKHVANDMNEHDASLKYWGELTYKWSRNWKPYNQLTKEEKEKDRVWARKVLSIARSQAYEEGRREAIEKLYSMDWYVCNSKGTKMVSSELFDAIKGKEKV